VFYGLAGRFRYASANLVKLFSRFVCVAFFCFLCFMSLSTIHGCGKPKRFLEWTAGFEERISEACFRQEDTPVVSRVFARPVMGKKAWPAWGKMLAGVLSVGVSKGEAMKNVCNRALAFIKNEDGPTATEYAVMLALIIIAALTAITALGSRVSAIFSEVTTGIGG
jgi:pilus assembly protein Flp/PilA